MQKAKQIYQKYKNIFHNLSYMTILKVFMLVLPLISYPYLIRVVGSENFGLVVYTLSIIAFFRIFVKFGFEMSAVKNVAQNSQDKEKLSIIVPNNSIKILKDTYGDDCLDQAFKKYASKQENVDDFKSAKIDKKYLERV